MAFPLQLLHLNPNSNDSLSINSLHSSNLNISNPRRNNHHPEAMVNVSLLGMKAPLPRKNWST
jgi:hypothetical protein